jgi:nicotinamide phosphoribosyltransferase
MDTSNLPAGGVDNIILCSDSYKVTHHKQYPPLTTRVYSYFESRGGKFENTVFFGLQYLIKRWLIGPIVTEAKIKEAKELLKAHFFGQDFFNEAGWRYILEKHGGCLPVRIKAVPEGTVLGTRNVLFTVENTDPECYWLTNFLETLLVEVWYPMTVATNSYYQKVLLATYLESTAETMEPLKFQLHDFGYRGSTSVESAGIGGAAHLVNFYGTDTIAALMMARKYYGCELAGHSVPAAEHSTITTWARDGELAAFRNMLEKFPNGVVSIVSDSYDVWNACEQFFGSELHDLVVSRESRGARLVIRPDSGDPLTVILKVLTILSDKFGVTTNQKGYKLLPSYLRILQGDGISYDALTGILEGLKVAGWSTENLVFGSGGALLQRVDRDTQKCAYKCSYAIIDGKPVNVFKDPVTDTGKKSKKGRLRLVRNVDGHFETEQEVPEGADDDDERDELVTVYENGYLVREWTFEEVRNRAGDNPLFHSTAANH